MSCSRAGLVFHRKGRPQTLLPPGTTADVCLKSFPESACNFKSSRLGITIPKEDVMDVDLAAICCGLNQT
jgi:hypothetical protein